MAAQGDFRQRAQIQMIRMAMRDQQFIHILQTDAVGQQRIHRVLGAIDQNMPIYQRAAKTAQ